MYNICVFAGTTEGRELVEFLSTQPLSVTACVATEYGEACLRPAENLTISAKRLTAQEMEEMLGEEHFALVVDATHPYASEVTENIAAACAATNTRYLRLLRDSAATKGEAVFVKDIAEAVAYLNGVEGNILLTTGSKELWKFTAIDEFESRVFARVLPMEESLQLCRAAGVKPAHILAMQGPFSHEMNVAMLKSVGAAYLVTKDSGAAGGFEEKLSAAQEAGVIPIIIGRPPQREGQSLHETVALLQRELGLQPKAKVSVVGIGPGSREAMTGEVRSAIAEADCIIGAARMVAAVAEKGQATYDAIAPEDIAEFIAAHGEYRRFTVVMSGDVGFFSGAKKLLPLLGDCDVEVLPGLSSLVYLCAKLGVSYEDIVPVSLHGRGGSIVPHVRHNKHVFALVGGENGAGRLCEELCAAGIGHVRVSVGERLSYHDERITTATAGQLEGQRFQPLSVVLIENPAPDAVVTHGLPDEAFLRAESVPMTKSEVRAVCLSKLRLTERALCWDIGAGTGSVSIEMALQARKGSVYAIERKAEAVALLRENREKFFADNLTVAEGLAPDACKDLPAPSHAFIGGSAGNMKEIIAQLLRKNPNVRIVATAIALESVAELTACVKDFAFAEAEVVCLNVARSRRAGAYQLMQGQNPIYIFTLQGGNM